MAAKKRKPMDAMALAGIPPKRGRPGGMERPPEDGSRERAREAAVAKGIEQEMVQILIGMVANGDPIAEAYLRAFVAGPVVEEDKSK